MRYKVKTIHIVVICDIYLKWSSFWKQKSFTIFFLHEWFKLHYNSNIEIVRDLNQFIIISISVKSKEKKIKTKKQNDRDISSGLWITMPRITFDKVNDIKKFKLVFHVQGIKHVLSRCFSFPSLPFSGHQENALLSTPTSGSFRLLRSPYPLSSVLGRNQPLLFTFLHVILFPESNDPKKLEVGPDNHVVYDRHLKIEKEVWILFEGHFTPHRTELEHLL